MTKLMNSVAIASAVAIGAAPAFAQDTTTPSQASDPFVSTQEVQGTAGLSGAAIGGLTLVVVGGIAFLVDSDGNVVSTTTTN